MKKIGMIVAVEIQSVLDKYGSQLAETEKAGYKVLEYQTNNYHLVILNCGAGEIAAASGTQFLISEYGVDLVVNFGVVGGLTGAMSTTKVCIVDKVVHYDFDTSAVDNIEVGRYLQYPDIYIPVSAELKEIALRVHPELVPVICASGDKFVSDEQAKRNLHDQFGADICEMEAAGIALTCNRNKVPCVMIKIVSDSIKGGYQEFLEMKNTAATICLEIVDKIMEQI